MKSADLLRATFLLIAVLISLPNQALSASTGQQSRSHSAKAYPNEAHQQAQSYSHKPATTIQAVKSLYLLHGSGSGSGSTTASSNEVKDDFARLNKRNKYGGPITRDAVHEAVVQAKRQRPSQDIVVMGVASWN